MNSQSGFRRFVTLPTLALAGAFFLWLVFPLVHFGWKLLIFPHYDYSTAILPYDIECRMGCSGTNSIVLPKGLLVYPICRHDYARMSLDETAVFKVYLRLDAKTIRALHKDTDPDEPLLSISPYGDLEEKMK